MSTVTWLDRLPAIRWSIVGAALIAASISARPASAQDAGASLPLKVPPGTELVVADDARGVESLLHLSGEQDKLAATVSYASFSSGPLRLEAIRAGAAHLAYVGDVPAILAHYTNAGVLIVGGIKLSGKGPVITTAPGSTISSLADLKGKRIAITDGTGQQAVLLRNLKSAGLGIKDIQAVNLGVAEYADALRGGQIDAAVLKQPDRARYLQTAGEGAREIDHSPEAAAEAGVQYFYASTDALNDPAKAAAIRDFIIHYYRASLWRNSHQREWIDEYLVKGQKLKPENAASVAESEGDRTTIPGLAAQIPTQQRTIDLLQSVGVFAGKHLDAKDEFDPRFSDLSERSQASND